MRGDWWLRPWDRDHQSSLGREMIICCWPSGIIVAECCSILVTVIQAVAPLGSVTSPLSPTARLRLLMMTTSWPCTPEIPLSAYWEGSPVLMTTGAATACTFLRVELG